MTTWVLVSLCVHERIQTADLLDQVEFIDECFLFQSVLVEPLGLDPAHQNPPE